MKYDLDLSKMDIEKYKVFLKNQHLIPSRKILHENIDNNFQIFNDYGFKNILDLKQALSSTAKIDKLANETKISPEYLNILRRELGTFDKRGIPFKDFPIIDNDTISKLDKEGLTNTKDFYEYYYKVNNEKTLSEKFNISIEIIQRLLSLSSLVRINGIAALGAIAFYDAGYKTLKDIINSSKEEILEKINKVNNEKHYYNVKLGLKDAQFVIDYTNMIEIFNKKY